MFRGLYTAGTALTNNTNRLDVVTNNIANINTTGFKKDMSLSETFDDVLISKRNGTWPNDNFGAPVSVTSTEDNGTYAVTTNSGYFRVQSPYGVSYSTTMNFARSDDGTLKTYSLTPEGKIDTSTGNAVLGASGPVKVGTGKLAVDKSGNLTEGGKTVDQLVMKTLPSVIGTMNAGVRIDQTATDFSQGSLKNTDNPLDFALTDKGFFNIQTKDGVRYTRDGSFTINASKQLVTSNGDQVIGTEGPVTVDGTKVMVNQMGEILVDGKLVNKFKITAFDNSKDLRKLGDNLYKAADGVTPKEVDYTGTVEQGKIEGSNVDAIKEMVDMMQLFRNYESNQKLIRTYDDELGKAVNDIARV